MGTVALLSVFGFALLERKTKNRNMSSSRANDGFKVGL